MGKILLSVFVCMFAISAQAERWIVKNPKMNASSEFLRSVKSFKTLKLQNEYVIIDSNERMDARSLVNMFDAESAFEDMKIVIDQQPSDYSTAEKGWHTKNLEYNNLNSKYTGQGVIVAVLDTGVEYTHKNLKDKMWKNVKEIPNNDIDDDNNGLVDDYHGYNFNDNHSDPYDTGSHGTHCAGIIAATKDTETGVEGIAQGVQIMPLVIIGADSAGFLAESAVAIKYAVDNGAKILSNSWRVYSNWTQYMNTEGLVMLEEAIAYAGQHEVMFVAAGGNESKNLEVSNLQYPIYPLSFKGHENMIGIASTEPVGNEGEEKLSYFSNYGVKSLVVAAPGSYIYSTVPTNRWTMMSGTSMATPLVAGTLARGLSKGYNMKEAISQLNQTTKNTTYWQEYVTHGRIDIKKYLED